MLRTSSSTILALFEQIAADAGHPEPFAQAGLVLAKMGGRVIGRGEAKKAIEMLRDLSTA